MTAAGGRCAPITVEFRDLCLSVPVPVPAAGASAENKEAGAAQHADAQSRAILDHVSGTIRPGELLAIMGPSGAGKTTLLNCIAMRNQDFSGSLTLNGSPWSPDFARATAYMHQQDVFIAELTVQEQLEFAAEMSMARTVTPEARRARVQEVMGELGLLKCRHTRIGDPAVGGISCGERKRLSFAGAILTDPSLLLVDEPTSGLDSHLAEAIVRQLRSLARVGGAEAGRRACAPPPLSSRVCLSFRLAFPCACHHTPGRLTRSS
jgi:ABC-type multidrug transport system ATPase subunit|eukprot:COSAG01_NODE_2487_length_7592_cov_4.423328_1_plen_264_part_00